MSFYFNKKAMENRIVKDQFKALTNYRSPAHDSMVDLHAVANTGRTPADTYRDFDNQAVLEPREMGHLALLSKVMQFSRPVTLGKQVYEYRQTSRSGNANVSISGRKNIAIDHASFDYKGTALLVHDDAYGRPWLEQEANATEMFDGLVDDAENSERVVLESIDNYMWNGNALSVKGLSWGGIRNDESVAQAVLAVDLSDEAVDSESIRDEVKRVRDILLGSENNCPGELTLVVSYAIHSRWEDLVDTTNGSNITLKEYIMKLSGIKEIIQDSALEGNQISMLYIDRQGFHPVTAMPISTYAIPRKNFNDDYSFVKWAMIGFIAKESKSGKKRALYAE